MQDNLFVLEIQLLYVIINDNKVELKLIEILHSPHALQVLAFKHRKYLLIYQLTLSRSNTHDGAYPS